MTIQTSDTNNAISARKLISRNKNGFDVELAAELIVANLAKSLPLDLTQEHPDGARSINLFPQIIDVQRKEIIDIGTAWNFQVSGISDTESLKMQLPPFLEQLEEQLAKLPVGQQLQIEVGVSDYIPASRLTVQGSGLYKDTNSPNLSFKP